MFNVCNTKVSTYFYGLPHSTNVVYIFVILLNCFVAPENLGLDLYLFWVLIIANPITEHLVEAQVHLALDLVQGSILSTDNYWLCDIGQITQYLWALISSLIIKGAKIKPNSEACYGN